MGFPWCGRGTGEFRGTSGRVSRPARVLDWGSIVVQGLAGGGAGAAGWAAARVAEFVARGGHSMVVGASWAIVMGDMNHVPFLDSGWVRGCWHRAKISASESVLSGESNRVLFSTVSSGRFPA